MGIELYLGDCLEIMKTIPDKSIDLVLTDPPYELGFMGKAWDSTGIAYNIALWQAVLKVLKPGGHLLSFGGSRTYHRMACAIEDAGFEIRDQIMWVYGSGFPKSLNIHKALVKCLGFLEHEGKGMMYGDGKRMMLKPSINPKEYVPPKPISQEAKDWEGWGTALKPAHEPVVLARKPLSEKTVALNVLKWGVGGINIDGCRVETDELTPRNNNNTPSLLKKGFEGEPKTINPSPLGRFPANFIHDGSREVTELFPNVKGQYGGKGRAANSKSGKYGWNNIKQEVNNKGAIAGISDSGSASRFFYCAKASKKERDMGCGDLELKTPSECCENREPGSDGLNNPRAGAGRTSGSRNNHPTVKPLALMKYLITLVSKEGQVVLDPFLGSGTTGIAAKELNRDFIGIELNSEYFEIAKRRIDNTMPNLL